MRKARTDRA